MNELKKTITVWKGVALAVSMIIGSGLLGLPGLTIDAGNTYSAIGGWLFISIAIIPLIYIFTQLGLKFTSSAGLSKYAEEGVGKWGGYAVTAVLCGTFTIGIPALAYIGGAYTQKLFNFPESTIYLLAIAILAIMTLLNLAGIKLASLVNTTSLVALIGMVLVIVITNNASFTKGLGILADTVSLKVELNYRSIWVSSALLFWAFLGWENMSFGLEEFENPKKNIPQVYWLSYLIVITLYLSLAITSIGANQLGFDVKGASGLTALVEGGRFSIVLMTVMVLVILANANAWVFGASRLIFASGRDGILPSFLGKITNKGIPFNSLITLFIFYTIILFLVQYTKLNISTLILLVSQNFLVLYACSIYAYWKTEENKNKWVITILSTVSCGFLLSGFSWWIIYPFVLITIGYIGYYRAKAKEEVDSGQIVN